MERIFESPYTERDFVQFGKTKSVLNKRAQRLALLFNPPSVLSLVIIMSDHVDIEFQTCYSNFLTIMYDTKEEVQRAYEIMKEGSKTIYQLEATPYSSCRVVFVDRFGIRWGTMTEQTER